MFLPKKKKFKKKEEKNRKVPLNESNGAGTYIVYK